MAVATRPIASDARQPSMCAPRISPNSVSTISLSHPRSPPGAGAPGGRLLLGQADRGQLGAGVNRAGDAFGPEPRPAAQGAGRGHPALGPSAPPEPGRTGQVAGSEDARGRGGATGVDRDLAAGTGGHAGSLQVQP